MTSFHKQNITQHWIFSSIFVFLTVLMIGMVEDFKNALMYELT